MFYFLVYENRQIFSKSFVEKKSLNLIDGIE